MTYDVSDNELIYLYRCNNQEAFNYLSLRYKKRIYGIIGKKAAQYNVKNVDFDDIYQTCYITFLTCLERFDGNYIFYSYIINAIENVLIRLMHLERRKQKIVSLENEVINKGFLCDDLICDAPYLYQQGEIKNYIKDNFDELSQLIVKYKIKGYSYKEMTKVLGVGKKQIYNRVTKLKKTLKKGIYH